MLTPEGPVTTILLIFLLSCLICQVIGFAMLATLGTPGRPGWGWWAGSTITVMVTGMLYLLSASAGGTIGGEALPNAAMVATVALVGAGARRMNGRSSRVLLMTIALAAVIAVSWPDTSGWGSAFVAKQTGLAVFAAIGAVEIRRMPLRRTAGAGVLRVVLEFTVVHSIVRLFVRSVLGVTDGPVGVLVDTPATTVIHLTLTIVAAIGMIRVLRSGSARRDRTHAATVSLAAWPELRARLGGPASVALVGAVRDAFSGAFPDAVVRTRVAQGTVLLRRETALPDARHLADVAETAIRRSGIAGVDAATVTVVGGAPRDEEIPA